MYIKQNFITKEQATKINNRLACKLRGILPENRVMIVTPKNTNLKVGGIILPDTTDSKDLPRKGVVVQIGAIDDPVFLNILSVGKILTYGMYAGKEIYFPEDLFETVEGFNPEDHVFTVLSTTEIIYTELNNN